MAGSETAVSSTIAFGNPRYPMPFRSGYNRPTLSIPLVTQDDDQVTGIGASLCWLISSMWPMKWKKKAVTGAEASFERDQRARTAYIRDPRPYKPTTPVIGRPKLQTTSTLLYRLPLELRQEIFRLAVGESGIRLIGSYYRWFYSTECVPDETMCAHVQGGEPKVFVGRLPLLLSCRQTYIEAIDLLYTSNTFCFRGHEPLIHLHALMTPQRLHLIRSLILVYPVFYAVLETERVEEGSNALCKRDWYLVWEMLSEMRGLQHLYVDLWLSSFWNNWASAAQEAHILAPVTILTRPLTSFRLKVPWPSTGVVEVGGRVYEVESGEPGEKF